MATVPAPARKRMPRFLELDGVRGVCALILLIYHVYQGSWEDPGGQAFAMYSTPDVLIRFAGPLLTTFFILSGFGVAIPIARAALAGRRQASSKRWFARRSAAIVPLYVVVTCVMWEIHYGGSADQWLDLGHTLTFTQIYSDDRIFRIVPPLWFVAVLMHWYLIVAFVVMPVCNRVAALGTRAQRLRALYAIAAALVTVGLAYKGVNYWREVPVDRRSIWFNWPMCLDSLGLGFGLAVLVVDRGFPKVGSRGWALGLGLTGLGLHWTLVPHMDDSGLVFAFHTTVGAVAYTMVTGAVIIAPSKTLLRKVLRSRVLVYLGVISVTTYLLQDPLLRSLKSRGVLPLENPDLFPWAALGGIAAAVALAAAAHHLLEVPLARFATWLLDGRKPSKPRTRGVWKLREGLTVPSRPVVTAGGPLNLAATASEGPLVLVSVPGVDAKSPNDAELAGWRPLLRELRDWRFAVEAFGGRIVGVSRLAPEALARIAAEERLGFELASDPDGEFLSELGIPTVEAADARWSPSALAVTGESGRIVSVISTDPPVEVGAELGRLLEAAPGPRPQQPAPLVVRRPLPAV